MPIAHPRSGWVQQDAAEIWTATLAAIAACCAQAPDARIVALGISNQRESILIWDRRTGEPLGPVVTWQCRRTADACDALKRAGHEPQVVAKTGLPLDPMFPPTKAAWLLENHGAGVTDICVGTVDSWLIWNFSGGMVHATDRSNAARTQMFDLARGEWDAGLCTLFGVDIAHLPHVADSAHIFGETQGVDGLPDGIPIASAIGDSHAALFGHGATRSGDGKITFGTGSSIMTTIPDFVAPPPGITTTVAWSLDGRSTYALEGNILVSASIFPWTAAMLGLPDVGALLDLAQSVEDANGVHLVPAHVGLGSPHWDSAARGTISGLSFGAGPAHVARAAADSLAHQVADVCEAMDPTGAGIGRLFVDGGPSTNPFLMQLVADALMRPVTPCRNAETSALGAAHLAGLATGFWPDLDTVGCLASHDAPCEPQQNSGAAQASRIAWREAIARTTLRV